MAKAKKIILLLLAFIMIIGVCGCMNRNKMKSNRKEPDSEYAFLMQKYIEEKYWVKTEVEQELFHEDGFNSAHRENVLVLHDENGVLFNVKARLSTPYDFYDDYVEVLTAAKIEKEIDMSLPFSTSRIYVVTDKQDINNIDTSAENIVSLILVSMIEGDPDEQSLKGLYEVYETLQQKNYQKIKLFVGFTDGSEEFKKAAENYLVHGKSGWKDYSGEVYAELYVTEKNLSFDEFAKKVVEK